MRSRDRVGLASFPRWPVTATSEDILSTLMVGQSVKIIARLRPPIQGELSDNGIRIITTDDGLPSICVNNPRDHSQVFKFP
jgi:hypothetical protein